MKCLARQHSDQMICHQCGLVWDVNDPEPPVCLGQQRSTNPLDGCSVVAGGAAIGSAKVVISQYPQFVERLKR